MSGEAVVAKRYAKALFDVAVERDEVVRVEDELKQIVALIHDHPDFGKLLRYPNIDSARKFALLQELFHGKVSESIISLFHLLLKRGREAILDDLSQAYTRIANEAMGQANAVVYTAFALTDEEKKLIDEQFGKLTGKRIRSESVVDPGLLGGVKIRIGDRLYDGSLSGKLERMEKMMNQSKAVAL